MSNPNPNNGIRVTRFQQPGTRFLNRVISQLTTVHFSDASTAYAWLRHWYSTLKQTCRLWVYPQVKDEQAKSHKAMAVVISNCRDKAESAVRLANRRWYNLVQMYNLESLWTKAQLVLNVWLLSKPQYYWHARRVTSWSRTIFSH